VAVGEAAGRFLVATVFLVAAVFRAAVALLAPGAFRARRLLALEVLSATDFLDSDARRAAAAKRDSDG
jgi:hypothetical protein